jgi:hypothetical protein
VVGSSPHRAIAQSSKNQAPSSRENQEARSKIKGFVMELDVWSFSGAWCLDLGASKLIVD